jgi:hypothetical protein
VNTPDRLAEVLLRLAERRWPAEVRDEQAREWAAELHALRTDPGTGALRRASGQLRFALSLAGASPVEDEHGVPRGWREGLPEVGRALRPVLTLVLFGVLAVGVVSGIVQSGCEWGLGLLGVRVEWPATYLPALPIITVAAWWLGRRMPVRWAGIRRLGPAGSAAVAPMALAVAFAVLVVGVQSSAGADGGAVAVSLCAGALAWIPLTAALAVAVVRLAVRGRRWLAATLAVTATPLVAELAITAAALPATLGGGAGPVTALTWAPRLLAGRALPTGTGTGTGSWYQSPDGISLFNATSMYPVHLLLFTGLALGYGLGAARPRHRQPATRRQVAGPAPLPDAARTPPILALPAAGVAGLAALVAGLFSWAYTLAILTPAMPLVGRSAPMPGGDGELYMWVAELRWGSITLAGLALLLTAADRRAAPLAAVVQTAALLIADGILARAGAAGAGGLRAALGAAAVAATLAWWIAGASHRHGADALTARRRLVGVAVTAACCGPILLQQGTAAINHPYLPAGLAGVTSTLPAMLAVLAGYAAAAARPGPLTRPRLAALVAGPALLLGAWGAATCAGVPYEITVTGMLLSAPMTVMVVGAMRAGRPRRRWAAVTAWAGLVLVSPLASALFVGSALALSIFAANILFAVAGSSWAADGMSLLPGAVIVAASVGVLAARRLIRPDEPPHATASDHLDLVALRTDVDLADREDLHRTVTTGPVERATQPPDGSFLPAVDSQVPVGIQATATDGTVIDNGYLAGRDVVVAFLMDQCTTCTAKLPELRTALAGLPAGWPRPVVVLSGSADACSHYRSALEPVAHVVEDGPVKSGAGVVRAFRLHSFPAVLVLSGGTVRRSGMTAREVELAAA